MLLTKVEMQARQKHKQREEEVVQQISNFSRVE